VELGEKAGRTFCQALGAMIARRVQREKNQALIELLRSWSEEGDEEEQRRAFENLKQTLDEDRRGYRTIYA
jgi:hypothetical protein